MIFADWHFDNSNQRDVPLISESVVEQLLKGIEKYKVDAVFWLGDILHKANMQTDMLLMFQHLVNNFGLRTLNKKVEHFIVGGNHEYTPGHNSALDLVRWPSNFTVVTKEPLILERYYKKDIVLIPYIHNEYNEVVKECAEPNRICMSHCLINGVVGNTFGKPIPSKHKAVYFKKYHRVFLGDVHRHCKIKNITYCGNLIQRDYRDYGNKQGYIIYDLEQDRYKYINLDLPELELGESNDDEENADFQTKSLSEILQAQLPVTSTLTINEAVAALETYLQAQELHQKTVKKFIQGLQAQLCNQSS